MRYPGGKGKTYQHIINLMPPHRVYIETHLGGGAVMRHKRPAARNIGIDVDPRVIKGWQVAPFAHVELVCARAEDFLQSCIFAGDELVYLDPPYHPGTRRRKRVYRHDYTEHDHERLCEVVNALPCKVIVSGYTNSIYQRSLRHWETVTFRSKTHADVRTETLWFNFEPPTVLHDARHLGRDFRDREATKRRLERLQDRIHRLEPTERAAFAQWLHATYPLSPVRLPQ